MGRIIGIDLGTTTSEIAYIKNGKPEMIINNLGERITPSVVGFNDDYEIIVGKNAKKQAPLKSDKTIMEVKRLMGTDQKVTMGNKEYYPQEVSSIILKELKKYAEEFLCEEVTEAVITVPANFDEFQRRATIEAGEMAGLKVERIINEPTAAALAYGINNLENDEKVLVYDLGGGTFDVTVLELFEGILDVKASRGNNKLGGKDFDERIEKYVIEDFKAKHGVDLSQNNTCLARIKESSEIAKIELSSMESTEINIPFISMDNNGVPLGVEMKLTRAKFEELIADLVNSTEKQIRDALKGAKYDAADIDVVLSVGGSSRIPCVRALIQNIFKDKMKISINPDEAVALGAAIQAGIKNDEISSEDSVLLTDVCNHSLGMEVVTIEANNKLVHGIYDPIIMKDSKVPATKAKSYCTIYDDQTEIMVNVYQGDGRLVMENTKLGELLVDEIPKGPAEREFIIVEFTYNLNGMLEVYAKVSSTGKEVNTIINTSKSFTRESSYSFNELNNNESNSDNFNSYDSINQNSSENIDNSKLAALVKGTLQLAENKLKTVNSEDAKKIEDLIRKLKKAVMSNDGALVERYDDELTDLLFDMN